MHMYMNKVYDILLTFINNSYQNLYQNGNKTKNISIIEINYIVYVTINYLVNKNYSNCSIYQYK